MNWFRRLQWKLTFSYTLVTVGAVLIVVLALVAIVLLLFGSDLLATALSSGMRQELAPEARTYLAQSPPDLAGASGLTH